jgi:lipopolysaccharide/colanic/teichoic acid biosynthesis glycosyltransferase
MAKRAFDIAFAAAALAVLWPAFLLIWAAITLEDGEPCLFRQERIGRDGQPFQILKFRSMRVGSASAGPSITKAGDSRITSVGRLLRASKLDELPQLINVLRGDMSVVGPRPEVPKYVALYTEDQRRVLSLKPGITDEASIEFRNEEAMLAASEDSERFYVEYCIPRKIEINLRYASGANVMSDLGVIVRTLAAIAHSRPKG